MIEELAKSAAKLTLAASREPEEPPPSLSTPTIVSEDEPTTLHESIEHITSHTLLALDCEGVDLGRSGQICIVQLSTPVRSFLFDVHEGSRDSEMVIFLKSVLENADINKIIHDCKMDSDALYHLLGITLRGVHDTQAWDFILHGNEHNLNRTLVANGCQPNAERDGSVYDRNVAFWASRPLTQQMIDWAAGDISSLFELHDTQMRKASASIRNLERCRDMSNQNCSFLREKIVHIDRINGHKVGKFIGKGGSNLRMLRMSVPGTFFQLRGRRGEGKLLIYGESDAAIKRAVALLRPYK